MPTIPLPDRQEVLSAIFRETERYIVAWEPVHTNFVAIQRAVLDAVPHGGMSSERHKPHLKALAAVRDRLAAEPRPHPILIQKYLTDDERAAVVELQAGFQAIRARFEELKSSTDMEARGWAVINALLHPAPFGAVIAAVTRIHREAAAKLEPPPSAAMQRMRYAFEQHEAGTPHDAILKAINLEASNPSSGWESLVGESGVRHLIKTYGNLIDKTPTERKRGRKSRSQNSQ